MSTVTTNINTVLSKVGDANYTEFFGSVNTWELTSSEYSAIGSIHLDSGLDDQGSFSYNSVRFRSTGNVNYKTVPYPVRPYLAF